MRNKDYIVVYIICFILVVLRIWEIDFVVLGKLIF